MDYINSHKKIYDKLAREYEKRATSLTPVTRHAVDKLAQHLKPKASILELGCGVGLAAKLLTEKAFSVTCIELSPNMISFARSRSPNSKFIQGDFLETNFKETFDAIFAFAFIHLFPKRDAVRIFKKIHSILNPGGILYIGTTKSEKSSEGWEAKSDYQNKCERFRKRWTESEFRKTITRAGFDVVDSLTQIDPFHKEWVDLVGIRR